MMRFRASFSDIVKITQAAKEVRKEALKQSNEVPRLAARGYAAFMITAIFKQQYRSSKPYNKKYEEWKLKHIKHLEQWRVEDYLIKSLKATKISNGVYFGGVRSGIFATHSVGRSKPQTKEIAYYGAINEQLRPVFEPGFKDYAVKQFPNEVKKSGNKIGLRWKK